jgi:hypothetical protein
MATFKILPGSKELKLPLKGMAQCDFSVDFNVEELEFTNTAKLRKEGSILNIMIYY